MNMLQLQALAADLRRQAKEAENDWQSRGNTIAEVDLGRSIGLKEAASKIESWCLKAAYNEQEKAA